jgi:hypothetical protein
MPRTTSPTASTATLLAKYVNALLNLSRGSTEGYRHILNSHVAHHLDGTPVYRGAVQNDTYTSGTRMLPITVVHTPIYRAAVRHDTRGRPAVRTGGEGLACNWRRELRRGLGAGARGHAATLPGRPRHRLQEVQLFVRNPRLQLEFSNEQILNPRTILSTAVDKYHYTVEDITVGHVVHECGSCST